MNRREFLKQSAALGVLGSVVVPKVQATPVSLPESFICPSQPKRYKRYFDNVRRYNTDTTVENGVKDVTSFLRYLTLSDWKGRSSKWIRFAGSMLVIGDAFAERRFSSGFDYFDKWSPEKYFRLQTTSGKLVEFQKHVGVMSPALIHYQEHLETLAPDYRAMSLIPIDMAPSLADQYRRLDHDTKIIRFRPSDIMHMRLVPDSSHMNYPYGLSYGELLDLGYSHAWIIASTLLTMNMAYMQEANRATC